MSHKFVYTTLDPIQGEIRLIKLLAGSPEAPIRCTLEVQQLVNASYEALSYEWGSERNSKEIELEGHRFPVRDNLWQALHHIRSEYDTLILWVDAISINQNDCSERGHQVEMMAEVYRKATSVRVWLGLGDRASRTTLEALEDIWEAKGIEEQWPVENSYSKLRHLHLGEISAKAHLSLLPLQETLRFLQRSYWTRMWIVQEYVLAQAVLHCGKKSIDGAIFDFSIAQILDCNTRPNWKFASLLRNIEDSYGGRIASRRIEAKNQTLGELLASCKASRCVDPRDKLYALLGMPSDVGKNTFVVDYTKDIIDIEAELIEFLYISSDNTSSLRNNHSPERLYQQCKFVESFFHGDMMPHCWSTFLGLPISGRGETHGQAWKIPKSIATGLIAHKLSSLLEDKSPYTWHTILDGEKEQQHDAYFILLRYGTMFSDQLRLAYCVLFWSCDKSQYAEFAFEDEPDCSVTRSSSSWSTKKRKMMILGNEGGYERKKIRSA
jgi:hypothetical protein